MRALENGRMMRTGSSTRGVLAWCAVVAMLGLAGCSGLPSLAFWNRNSRPVSRPPDEEPMLDRDTYVIGSQDRLNIVVWKNPELTTVVPVRPDGRISVPLVDDVQAAGLTAAELKLVLQEKLEEYVAAPEVTVIVSEVLSRRVYLIGGGVARQTAVQINQDMRVLDAIATAGGFTAFAKKDGVRILRRTSSGLKEYRFDYDAFLRGDAPLESNFLLQPGDTIIVPD